MRGKLIVVDAPSGGGKTPYLKARLSECQQAGARVVYSADDDFLSMCLAYWRTLSPEAIDALTLEDVLGCADVFAVDDLDLVLRGRYATQRSMAAMMARSLLDGKIIYIAGIDLRENAPIFFQEIEALCPRAQEWILIRINRV